MNELPKGVMEVIGHTFGQDAALRVYPSPPDTEPAAVVAGWRGDHWLFVTVGLTELTHKESADPNVSGWGFELSLRAEGTAGAEPGWAPNVLRFLGSYVFQYRTPLAVGDHAPLPPGLPYDGLYVMRDALQPTLCQGSFGAWELRQVTLVTKWQHELIERWNSYSFDAVLRRSNPRRIVLARPSPELETPAIRAELLDAATAEGQTLQIHHGDFAVRRSQPEDDSAEPPILGEARVLTGLHIYLPTAVLPELRRSIELSLARGQPFYLVRPDALCLLFTVDGTNPIGLEPAIRVNLKLDEIERFRRRFAAESGTIELSGVAWISWGIDPPVA